MLSYTIVSWNWYALPFFIILSLLGGTLAVYFTLIATRIKRLFANISNNFIRVNLGALAVGLIIYFFPTLYGDSYQGIREILYEPPDHIKSFAFILTISYCFKTFGCLTYIRCRGDEGVFAPSIVAGAFLGLLVAFIGNHYLKAKLIPINFALVGAAATLSASLLAPFTSLVLICNLLPNGYVLFLPILLGSIISYLFSKKLLPYNVYTYDFYLTANT